MRLRDALPRAPALLVAVLMLAANGFAANNSADVLSSLFEFPDTPTVFPLTADIVFARGVVSWPLVNDRISPAGLLSTLDADTVPSPGIVVGVTSYDMQHPQAQPRQIAVNAGSGTVHFGWAMLDIVPETYEQQTRVVSYNSWDKIAGSVNFGGNGVEVSLGDFAHGGSVGIDVTSDNLCQMTLHQRLELHFPYSAWHLNFPIEGSGLHLDYELPTNSQFDYELEHLFPDIAVSQTPGGSATDIVHIISTGSEDFGGYVSLSDHIWYYRYDGGAPIPVWVGPVLIDSSRSVSYDLDADDNSSKVAIAYTSDYITDGFNQVANVAYRESPNTGLSWIDGSGLGEINKLYATTFADPDGPQAWTEVSAAYDHHSNLHLVFPVQRIAYQTEQMAIYHWSDARGTIRPVTTAHYDNPGTWWYSLNLSQVSLGIGDGTTSCFGGTIPNEDFLYVLYLKLGGETPEEQADTSKLGYANGELYLTVSPDGGADWSVPINLTSTKTPDCTSTHPDSTCASEAWATVARDVSDIEILYIRDYEAESFDRTGWTLNKVMYLNFPGGTADDPFLCPGAGCYCPCHGDAQCDGVINVLDVVQTVIVAFRDGEEIFDYDCPYSRTDVTCDGVTNVLDVVLYVDVAFRGGDPGVKFCDPCAP